MWNRIVTSGGPVYGDWQHIVQIIESHETKNEQFEATSLGLSWVFLKKKMQTIDVISKRFAKTLHWNAIFQHVVWSSNILQEVGLLGVQLQRFKKKKVYSQE